MIKTSVPKYFADRRSELMKKYPDAVFVMPGAESVLRNPDVDYPFRQESNLYYLTGYDEAESCLILSPQTSGSKKFKTTLFVRERSLEREMWEGQRYGTDGAMNVFGADESYLMHELSSKLADYFKGADRVFYRMGQSKKFDDMMLAALEKHRLSQGRSGKTLLKIEDPQSAIGEMRLFKKKEEAELMRKACSLSARAYKTVIQETKPGMNEADIEALIEYTFKKNGAHRLSYGSIVAGGKNATCLHYRENNEPLKDGDLLLIDAGAEFDYYGADITRTFPIGREFTKPQAKLYDALLKIQKDTIAMVKPGLRYSEMHKFTCESLTEVFLSQGMLKGSKKDIMDKMAFRRFFPHGTGHWLGMDVHDVGLYTLNGESRLLEPGMLFTIEPGIYIQPGDNEAPAEFKNLGMRIEDDILVTESGCEVLTHEAPKERAEIESLKK